jgi:hypothetical protein
MERVDARIKLDRPRCPYCHGELARGEDVAVCRDCDAKHHEACWPADGTCATCGGAVALRAAPPAAPRPRATRSSPRGSPKTLDDLEETGDAASEDDPPDERDDRPPDAALHRYLEVMGKLRKHQASMFRQWWFFLLPHAWIPLFWPVLFIAYLGERKQVRGLVEEARSLRRRFKIPAAREELEVLNDSAAWGGE